MRWEKKCRFWSQTSCLRARTHGNGMRQHCPAVCISIGCKRNRLLKQRNSFCLGNGPARQTTLIGRVTPSAICRAGTPKGSVSARRRATATNTANTDPAKQQRGRRSPLLKRIMVLVPLLLPQEIRVDIFLLETKTSPREIVYVWQRNE